MQWYHYSTIILTTSTTIFMAHGKVIPLEREDETNYPPCIDTEALSYRK